MITEKCNVFFFPHLYNFIVYTHVVDVISGLYDVPFEQVPQVYMNDIQTKFCFGISVTFKCCYQGLYGNFPDDSWPAHCCCCNSTEGLNLFNVSTSSSQLEVREVSRGDRGKL